MEEKEVVKAVIQRVKSASVTVDGNVVSGIANGILVLLGVGIDDSQADVDYLAEKISHLRIFEDTNEKMNLSLLDIKGEALVVSQFTLYADCKKGRRPGFSEAALPEKAEQSYESFKSALISYGVPVKSGMFQAHMDVELVNDGPVTIVLDTKH